MLVLLIMVGILELVTLIAMIDACLRARGNQMSANGPPTSQAHSRTRPRCGSASSDQARLGGAIL